MSNLQKAKIYTDGSCLGNPGPGGWASIILFEDGREIDLRGGEENTTNNRMELMGVISAFRELDPPWEAPCEITVYTDSQYIAKAFNDHWLESWKANGWKRSSGELKNVELWQELDELVSKHSCTFKWVKGHNGDKYNEKCDAMANEQAQIFAGEIPSEDFEDDDETAETENASGTELNFAAALDDLLKKRSVADYRTDRPCGGLMFCEFCENADEYPCACAYTRCFHEIQKAKAERINELRMEGLKI